MSQQLGERSEREEALQTPRWVQKQGRRCSRHRAAVPLQPVVPTWEQISTLQHMEEPPQDQAPGRSCSQWTRAKVEQEVWWSCHPQLLSLKSCKPLLPTISFGKDFYKSTTNLHIVHHFVCFERSPSEFYCIDSCICTENLNVQPISIHTFHAMVFFADNKKVWWS